MPNGHYTSISAYGPGDNLWYTADGTWSSDIGAKYIFQQTHIAVHTAIQNLPAGYHTRVNFENVPIVPQSEPPAAAIWYPCQC